MKTDLITWDGCYKEILELLDDNYKSFEEFQKLIHTDDMSLMKDALDVSLKEQTQFECQWRTFDKDGNIKWIYSSGRFIFDDTGEPVQMIGAFQDITNFKKIQEALASSERKYREMFENIADGCIILDDDLVVTAFNSAAEKILHTAAEKVLGINLFDAFPIARGSVFDQKYTQAVKEKKFLTFETYFEPFDEWYDVRVHPQRNGIIVFFQSTTEIINQKNIITRQQKKMQETEKLRVIGQLAGGIAHNFNNQLAGISGYADLLLTQTDNERMCDYINSMIECVENCATLTKRLLYFSRKGKYRTEAILISVIIENVIDIISNNINKNIQIEKQLSEENITIIADPSQIESVFLDIALNSLDAMPNGGTLKFTVEYIDNVKNIDAEIAENSSFLCVTVSDTGCGMEAETLEKVFEPFFTTKSVGEGTGMGLSGAFGTIKNHNGDIHIESEPGKGTSVHVYLPAVHSRKPEHVSKLSSTIPREKCSGTVLLIDDETFIITVAKDILETFGYTAITYKDPVKGLEYYQKNHETVDIVVLDWVMPRMDGGELLRELQKINTDVSVLITSGYSNRDTIDQLGITGKNIQFLEKPYTSRKLYESLHGLMHNK